MIQIEQIPDEEDDDLEKILFKNLTPISKPLRIALVGEISVGKSSLLNALLGVDICEVNELKRTACICAFHYAENVSAQDTAAVNDACAQIAAQIQLLNKLQLQQTTGWQTVDANLIIDGIANEYLCSPMTTLVDTPGLNEADVDSVQSFEQLIHTKTFENMRNLVKDCHVVMIVVDPSKIESRTTVQIVAAIATCNPRIMIVLNKADTITVKQQNKNNFIRKNATTTTTTTTMTMEEVPKIDEEEIEAQCDLLESKFQCPIVAVSCLATAPAVLSVDKIGVVVRSYIDHPFSKLREDIITIGKQVERVPINMFNLAYQKYVAFTKKLVPGFLGASIGIGSFAVGVGALLFFIPAVGQVLGVTAIASGLSVFAISSAAGLTIGGTMATVSGTIARKIVASKLAHNLVLKKNIHVQELKVSDEQWKEIEFYMAESVKSGFDKGYWNASYLPKEYNDEQVYHDATIVQVGQDLYFVSGVFLKRKLLVIKSFEKIVKPSAEENTAWVLVSK